MSMFKRVMAVGCTHGDLRSEKAIKQTLEFAERWKPEVRFELGDLIDTAAFRSGAAGTKDEAHSTRDDLAKATEWLLSYRPTHIAWGNHDWRLVELQESPNAIKADLASLIWGRLQDIVSDLGASQVPYDIEDGWFDLFGYCWGHGYMYNINALRDHAEMNGKPTVMAHLHAPHEVSGRTRFGSKSFCVGSLADDKKLKYGRRRRQSLTHGHGIVYGEVSETSSHLWLISAKNGEDLIFPPGI